MNIFVGNLSFISSEADVRKLFEGFGSVASVAIVTERKGIKSRGFGFVDMPDDQQAQAAIAALDNKEFMGRPLNVSPSYPKSETSRDSRQKDNAPANIEAKAKKYPLEESNQKVSGFIPAFGRKTRYKTGRRSLNFVKRHIAAGMRVESSVRKSKENPMRWRKKQAQPSFRKKVEGTANSQARPHQSRFKGAGKPKAARASKK